MRRHHWVATAAALLLSGCSPQPSLPSSEPVAEVRQAPAASSARSDSAPQPRPSAVPTTGTDPAALSAADGPAPTQLRVPSVDLDMRVLPVGVQDNGDMELPPSVKEAGWYRFGTRPSDPTGSTLVAAHVDSRAEGLGPFARLRGIPTDASALLTTQDGTVHRYRVVSVRKVEKVDLSSLAVFERDGPARLTLLTCGGPYDRDSGYRDNVVITATPE